MERAAWPRSSLVWGSLHPDRRRSHSDGDSDVRRGDSLVSGCHPPAVNRLDLDIEDGEFLVLVGPSGCGKSTSLRMLAGLEFVNGGRIRIGDRDVTRLAPKERDIAMVFQNYALYPHMTVGDNMAFALKIARVSKEERNAGSTRQRDCSTWRTSWTASPRRCPEASGNASRWAERSCASPRCS